MAFAGFNLCNPCCCPRWGYSGAQTDYFYGCCTPASEATLMYSMSESLFTSTLQSCTVFHAGPVNACDDWDSKPAYHSIISDWVAAGGRLIISGEFDTCLNATNFALLNTFASDVGTSMVLNYDHYGVGSCNTFSTESIGLTAGVANIYMGATASISLGSGVAVAKFTGGHTFVAIEKVGSGVVLMSGDSNVFTRPSVCGGGSNCSLWLAFGNMPIAEMY